MVQDEFHHYGLDSHLHEGSRPAEAGRLYLLRPGEKADEMKHRQPKNKGRRAPLR